MKWFILTLFLFCLVILPGLSQDDTPDPLDDSDSFTRVTYYPTPHGEYRNLLVFERQAIGDANRDGVVNVNDLPIVGATSAPSLGSLVLRGYL